MDIEDRIQDIFKSTLLKANQKLREIKGVDLYSKDEIEAISKEMAIQELSRCSSALYKETMKQMIESNSIKLSKEDESIFRNARKRLSDLGNN